MYALTNHEWIRLAVTLYPTQLQDGSVDPLLRPPPGPVSQLMADLEAAEEQLIRREAYVPANNLQFQ